MSKDGFLPPGVTHQMIEAHFGGSEDEGIQIDLESPDDTIIEIKFDGYLVVSEVSASTGETCSEFVFSVASARALARAISERVM